MNTSIYLSPPDLLPETAEYVKNTIQKGWIAPNGPENKKLESLIAHRIQLNPEQVVTCTSGTSAIHLVAKAIDVKQNDLIFCPSLTFIATINPFLQEGAKAWFVDSEEETGGMDPVLLEHAIQSAIKKGERLKAVIVVHLMGFPAKIKAIRELCDRYQLILIEDAAESLGSKLSANEFTHQYADIGVFSFNGNKLITTSGGGAVFSKNQEWMKRVVFYRDQAKVASKGYWHTDRGYNYALSNISASIGVSEWNSIDSKIEKKKRIFDRYQRAFQSIEIIKESYPFEGIHLPNYWLSVFFLEEIDREKVYQILQLNGIECRFMWTPLHEMPYLTSFSKTMNGVSDKWSKTGLCLPSGSGLSELDQTKVIEFISSLEK